MKSLSRILMIAIVLSAGALTLTAPAQSDAQIIDRIVARINAKIVTYFELKQAATPFMLQNGMDPSVLEDESRRQEIYKEVLSELVDRELLLQEAAKLDLSVSDQEVDQWLAYTRQQQNMSEEQFRDVIKQYDMSYSAYREMIRQNLLKIRLVKVKVGSQVSVSDDELEQAFRERFGTSGAQSKFIEVRHILVRPDDDSEAAVTAARQKAETALAELRNGEDFTDVANTHSEGPSGDQGGYLGTFGRGDLDPQFEAVAFELDKGEISDVVRTQFGFHVIEVMNVEMRADSNVEERKEQLRAQLQQEAVERQLQAYLQNLRSRSFVDVRF
jgi:parvulin-like peptidyl-prolyl isomerase